MPKKDKHMAAVDAAISNALSIELSRRRLKSGRMDENTPEDFDQEVERRAAEHPDDKYAYNRSLADCAMEFPVAFKSYKRQVDQHLTKKRTQELAMAEAQEFSSISMHIAYTAEMNHTDFAGGLEIVRSQEPKVAAAYDAMHQATVDAKYSKYSGGN